MPSKSQALAEFGTSLTYNDIPETVRGQAVGAILDTVGVSIFGSTLPWSRIVIDYALAYGAGGTSTILGTSHRVVAPFAALANGALGHAFEMDNLRQPSAGVHSGSTLGPALFAVGEEVEASGKDLITAFVAGCEIMSCIGDAAGNTAEKLGFHSPGLTGVFGSTVVAGRLLGLDAGQMAQAFGIAGSLCSGLLGLFQGRQWRHGEAAAHRPCLGRRRARRAPRQGWLRGAGRDPRGQVRLLRRLHPRAADGEAAGRPRQPVGDFEDLREMLFVPCHRAHAGAGAGESAGRARLRRGGCGRDPYRHQREGAEPPQHHPAERYRHGAVQPAVLHRHRALSRPEGAGLVPRQSARGSRHHRHGAARCA